MVTAIYLSLVNFDFALLETAKINGAGPLRAFIEVTWPLNWIGTAIGTVLVFIPCLASAVTPRFLGGPNATSFGMSLSPAIRRDRNLGAGLGHERRPVRLLVPRHRRDGLDHQSEAQRLHRGRQIMIGSPTGASKMAALGHGGAALPALCLPLCADPLRDLRLLLRRHRLAVSAVLHARRPMPICSAIRFIPTRCSTA